MRLRPCARCGKPVAGNYCPECAPEPSNRPRAGYRSYSSAEYRRSRQIRVNMTRVDGVAHCELCTAPVMPGGFECDHLVPLRDGGTDAVSNLRILCKSCHKLKTREDRRTR